MSEPNPPSRRTMPASVRERLRERPRLAAAAAMAVLATGAVFVATYGPEPGTPAAARPVSALDRCWNAVLAQDRTEGYPAFSTWRQVAVERTRTSAITSVLADGKPIFCVTTDTSVTVNDPLAKPLYAEGTRTAALLVTDDWLAGVADPAWKRIGFRDQETGAETAATPKQGLFATPRPPSLWPLEVFGTSADGQVHPGRGRGIPLGETPPPAIRVFDNPGAAPTWAKMFLAACIGNVPDAPTQLLWHAGVPVGGQGDANVVVMARSGDHVGMCRRSPGYEHEFTDLGVRKRDAPRQLVPVFRFEPGDEFGWIVLGVVPEGTTSMRITLAGGDIVHAMVANGTFAVELPPDSADEEGNLAPEMVPRSALASGPRNEVIYDGPLLEP
jgi:hypothetical protein